MIGTGIGSNKPESTSSQGPPVPTNPDNRVTETGDSRTTQSGDQRVTQ